MKKLAIVTWSQVPELYPDDSLILKPLHTLGFAVVPIPWDKKDVNWKNYDAVIIRSSNRYYRQIDEFIKWLKQLETKEVKLWNPAKTIIWNTNKKYLLELEKRGVSIIPTIWLEKKSSPNIEKILYEKQWNKAVIKPTIGAAGNGITQGIFYVTNDSVEKKQNELQQLLQSSDGMIQPFMEELYEEGEYSFIFIGGEYMHAVVKKLASEEFTTERRGATVEKARPSQELIQQAEEIYKKLPQPLLYGRIDGVNIHGKLHIMEVELIEPMLYFGMNPKSSIAYANAVKELIEK